MKICIILLYAATSILSVRSLQSNTVLEDLIASALSSIIERVYVLRSDNVFIGSNKADATHNAILRKICASFDRNPPITFILHDKDYMNGFTDRVNNIVLVDSYESFRSLLRCLTTTTLHQFGYYTVAFTNFYDNHDRDTNKLTNIFEDSWQNMILNINILTYSNATDPILFLHTYFPFAPSHCGNIKPIIWNSFENNHFAQTNKQLFPQKTENLFECPISVLAAPLRPYIFVTGNDSDGSSYTFDGIEYNLLRELSQRINFKLNFSVYWDSNLGVVFDNGSADGIFGMILERKYDMAVGAFVDGPYRKRILSSTKRYSQDDIILVVPNPTPYSSFDTLFFPFAFTTWIYILVTIAVALLVIKLLECNGRVCYEFVVGSDKRATPSFNLFRVLLTGGVFYVPKRSFARFLLMVWILACLVLQTLYQDELFDFIKMNRMKPSVASIDELIDRDISIKLIKENFLQFLKFDQRLDKLLIFVDPDSKWEYVTETEAYITLETQLTDETHRTNSKRTGQLLPKPKTIKIISSSQVIYWPKRFYLTEIIDDGITSMIENGLTSKWAAPYEASAILDSDLDKNVPRKLNMSQIVGMVEVWFGLLVLAAITFLLELLFPCLGIIKNSVINVGEITPQALYTLHQKQAL